MTPARQVLDLQVDLAERIEDPQYPLAAYLNVVANNMQLGTPVGREVKISNLVFDHVLSGRAFRVAANMTPEVQLRAEDETKLPQGGPIDPPLRHRGFAWFEEPIRFREIRNRMQVVFAITWGFTMNDDGRRGWLISLWGDVSREVDEVLTDRVGRGMREWHKGWSVGQHIRQYGGWAPVAIAFIPRDRGWGPSHLVIPEAQKAEIIADRSTPNPDPVSCIRYVGALWQLLSETVDVVGHESATATMVSTRKRRTPVVKDVTTVTLRRPSRPTLRPGTGKRHEYRSWVEGGYTITYWVGPGRKIPVKRTIGGHWSDLDESLPIRNRPKVYELKR